VNDLRSLLARLGKAENEEAYAIRLKLRQLLRRLIEDIVVLVVQANRDRVAYADIRLRTGERRQVTIYSGQRVKIPGIAGLDVRNWSRWPKGLREPQFQVADEAAHRMVEMEKEGASRTEIASACGCSVSRVSRVLVKSGRRKAIRKKGDDERQMTWHPAGRGWAKTYKGQRHFIGLGKLKAAYPRLVKDDSPEGSWKAANSWWKATRAGLDG